MRQLITRVDDRLHRRLKAKAAAEGRSVNALVTEVLAQAVTTVDQRSQLRERLERTGTRIWFPPPRRPPPRDTVIASLRGTGSAASAALAAERRRR